MKKVFLFLLVFPFMFIGCEDDEKEPIQDYTSFVVINKSEVSLPNVVAGYMAGDKYVKLASLGEIPGNDMSKEIIINDASVKSVYFFADYYQTIKINKEYKLKPNTKNTFTLSGDIETNGVNDKSDPTQYPQ